MKDSKEPKQQRYLPVNEISVTSGKKKQSLHQVVRELLYFDRWFVIIKQKCQQKRFHCLRPKYKEIETTICRVSDMEDSELRA